MLNDISNNNYGLEMNQTNDFRLLIDVLRDPRAFHSVTKIHISLRFIKEKECINKIEID